MKKYLMIGFAAVAFAACSNHDFETLTQEQIIQAEYKANFVQQFGQPASNQTWGFGTTRAFTRSVTAPACPDIDRPYDEAWVTTYNETAKEPNSTNVNDNYDNSTYANNWDVLNAIPYDGSEEDLLRQWFTGNKGGLSWDQLVAWAKENRPTWITYNADETFVTHFKITGEYTGTINVAASEGYTVTQGANGEAVYGERQDPFLARTVVVTGTWNINDNQRMGSGSTIVIANGGTVNIASGKQLQTVNQARIVVLPGGTLTGAGSVEVSNGNGAGGENYNGGTISVAKFNNNFGKFFNYGKFLVTEYIGGAKESNFYNHSLVHIKYTGLNNETPNARIFNACQFYCENNMRMRNYEGVMGSALIVGGQLMMSSSEDGTSTPTYVGLAAGALVKAGSLFNNGTSWTGPTEGGYAVLSIGKFDHMNWEQDHPEQGGYFANNIYLQADDLSNVPTGNGYQQKTDDGTENYTMSQAKWKFENVVANAQGNGNVEIVEKGDYQVIPADNDFVLGEAGCTPGFKIKKKDPDPGITYQGRIMVEDLSAKADVTGKNSDWDFNDVVFDWAIVDGKAYIKLLAAGGTLPIRIGGTRSDNVSEPANSVEIHSADKGLGGYMVNTGVNVGKTYSEFVLEDHDYSELGAKGILITVQKGGEWVEIQAEQGEPAAKFNCKVGTKWCDEYVNITRVYPDFTTWVANPAVDWTQGDGSTSRLTDGDLSNNE